MYVDPNHDKQFPLLEHVNNIAVGINIFGSFKRQDLCIDSLIRLEKQCKGITLYNIQQKGLPLIEHDKFTTIFDRGRTAANTVTGCSFNLPMVRDFFDALAAQGKDYFMFLNSDIIVTTKIAREVSYNAGYDAICGSRLAVEDISDINTTDINHSHLQIAGFDVYMIRTSWWLENREKFPDYIYAISAWDVDYAARLMVLGRTQFDNTVRPCCYHIMHEEKSHNDTPERAYNMKLFFEDNKPLCDAWHAYLFATLRARVKVDSNYLYGTPSEVMFIKTNFHNEDIHTFCSNWR